MNISWKKLKFCSWIIDHKWNQISDTSNIHTKHGSGKSNSKITAVAICGMTILPTSYRKGLQRLAYLPVIKVKGPVSEEANSLLLTMQIFSSAI